MRKGRGRHTVSFWPTSGPSSGLRAGCVVLLLVMIRPPSSSSEISAAQGQIPPLVQRFLERQDGTLTSYRALRHLEAHNARYSKHGWLEAWTSLDPEKGFTFTVIAEGGSGYVRSKVLRKALEREAEMHAQSEIRSAAVAPANYAFAEAAMVEGLASFSIEPKRKDSMLIHGRIFLTPDSADLVRIEGRLAKSPSFWTRRVDIVRRYQRIALVRVPIVMESTAQVLFAGESSFAMRYEYATINGQEVGNPQPRAGRDRE